ncbi:hypothetical protein [Streptosporangium subroseum]|uniref:hypothetical protein n=1 Tax=Streptosporangium subroseum TaxID=106412 RepID=UPI00308F6475|nr:hypothetical protein OHB15_02145 [Streptosporangium subroseum]
MAYTPEDLALPTALAEAAQVGFEWTWDEETDEAGGCDFELYDQFEELDRTAAPDAAPAQGRLSP